MAVTVLQWIPHEKTSARRLNRPGHVSMVLLYPDVSGKTDGFHHTITWFESETNYLCGQEKTGVAAVIFGTSGRWVPTNVVAEMEHLGSRDTIGNWNQDYGWLNTYMKHLSNAQDIPFNKFLDKRIRPPDRQVTILSRSDPDAYTGLFDTNIRTWWLAFVDRHNTYKLLSRSCAAVVGMGLIAGGAEAFVSKPWGVWTPNSVFNWADKIAKAVHNENEAIRGSKETLDEEAKKFPNPGALWTRNEWYRESEKNVTLFSRRYGLLKTIDSFLDIFHSIDKRSNLTKEFKKQAKLNCLSLITRALAQILRERDSTKRRAAIGQLAAQVQATREFVQTEERRLIEEQRRHQERQRQLLEEEIERHNEPINQLLDEIWEQQFNLVNLIEEVKSGKKLTGGRTIENLQFQLNLLNQQEQQLNLQLHN